MDRESKIRVMQSTWSALSKCKRRLAACGTAHISIDLLDTCRIRVSHLEWISESVLDFEPRFGDPYPHTQFEKYFPRTKATNYWEKGCKGLGEWSLEHNWDRLTDAEQRSWNASCALAFVKNQLGSPFQPLQLAAKGDWMVCGLGGLYQSCGSSTEDSSPSDWYFGTFLRSLPWPQDDLPTNQKELERLEARLEYEGSGEWKTVINPAIRRPGKKSLVHMAIAGHDNSDVNEHKILRSELIAAISIMQDQMRQRRNWHSHAVFPVFVYSWSGFQVRVLQVHYDFLEAVLMVRKTSYITIDSPKCEEEIKLLLRWMMNVPRGVTRWDELGIEDKKLPFRPSSTNGPPSPGKRPIPCA